MFDAQEPIENQPFYRDRYQQKDELKCDRPQRQCIKHPIILSPANRVKIVPSFYSPLLQWKRLIG
ncbi:hypothetical protein [Leptothermofonsia sp. ETS-13]|uniref:hypothetical protein n=1 Tax=Leptothermofonsia sp. ETS-13 TaxID=3035696 RepID=UPI003BA12E59